MKRTYGAFARAVILAVVAGVILFAGWCLAEAYKPEKAYTPNNLLRMSPEDSASESLVRLRIVGNSDSAQDQQVKLAARDALMGQFGKALSGITDKRDALALMRKNLGSIELVVNECLRAHGFAYGSRAALAAAVFPDRTYTALDGKELFLPKGKYMALEVVLGEGKGQNWWCVMYPPLCYFDLVQQAVLSERESVYGDVVIPTEFRSLFVDSLKRNLSRVWAILSAKSPGISTVFQKAQNLK